MIRMFISQKSRVPSFPMDDLIWIPYCFQYMRLSPLSVACVVAHGRRTPPALPTRAWRATPSASAAFATLCPGKSLRDRPHRHARDQVDGADRAVPAGMKTERTG